MKRYLVGAGLAVCCALATLSTPRSTATVSPMPEPAIVDAGQDFCWTWTVAGCCTLNPQGYTNCVDGELEWRCPPLPVQPDPVIGVMTMTTEEGGWSDHTGWGDVVVCWYKKPLCGALPGTCVWDSQQTLQHWCRDQPQPTTEPDCFVDNPQEPD